MNSLLAIWKKFKQILGLERGTDEESAPPPAAAPTPPPQEDMTTPPPRRKPVAKKILVVDDSITIRKVSTRLLEANHYEVATAKDGLDAIEVLKSYTPDLIMLDIEMPNMDGFEFATHVRNESAIPNVPIVMVTTKTDDEHRQRANKIGVQGYLGKPYSEGKLIETLESLLSHSGERK